MTDEKAALRKRCLLLRANLKSPEKDRAILKNFLCSPFFRRQSFFVYDSVNSEADTQEMIKTLLSSDKRVLLPRVEGKRMHAVPYSEERELVFGIPQPKRGEDCAAEIAVTPLLAFDGEGYRLGYGGGYYDRYFAAHGGLRVGLAYEGQAVDILPRGAHDVPLHALITETGVRYFI